MVSGRDALVASAKATSYDPRDRYQTVDDVAEDLRHYMGGYSISARRDNPWDKLKRIILKHHW